MTTLTLVLLALTLIVGAVDWYAVAAERRPIEYVAKPATMVPLIGAALALDPAVPEMRSWFVVALVFSLAGDMFLMIPRPERFFVPGLASFLIGHVLYIIGMLQGNISGSGVVVGAVLTFTAIAALGPTLVSGATDVDRYLGIPVLLYMLTISVMVTVAIGSGVWLAIAAALLFYVSDLCIGWSKFVADFRRSSIVIMVTYHLAQIGLVASMVVVR